jgi:hypothetical protein
MQPYRINTTADDKVYESCARLDCTQNLLTPISVRTRYDVTTSRYFESSAWIPSAVELAALNAGACIVLTFATSHPIVTVTLETPEAERSHDA